MVKVDGFYLNEKNVGKVEMYDWEQKIWRFVPDLIVLDERSPWKKKKCWRWGRIGLLKNIYGKRN